VVIGATSAGVFYGAQTLKQLVSGDGDQAKLYRATIRDWPAMRYRGFHDDISRGPVPTLDFQKDRSEPSPRTRSTSSRRTSSTHSRMTRIR